MTARRMAPALAGAIALVAGLGLGATAYAQGQVTAVSGGGAIQDGFRKGLFEPFAKETGIKVLEDTWNNDMGKVRAQVQAGKITWDLVEGDPHQAIEGCDEGILEKLDHKFLGDLKDFEPGAVTECGVGSHIFTHLWAWDGNKLKKEAGPKTVAQIWNNKTWPGKRGMPRRVYNVAGFALLADGVPVNDIFKVLGGPGGAERMLASLDKIKKDIVWWTVTSKSIQMLADGEVDFVQTALSRWFAATEYDKKNFVPMWDGQFIQYTTWMIPKGAPNKEQALKLLAYIMDPKKTVQFTEIIPYAPTRKSSNQYLSERIKPKLATAQGTNMYFNNRVWWADHVDAYTKRFEAWIAQ